MSDRDQQDGCPKAFYCLPESCGDCPRDQQDEPKKLREFIDECVAEGILSSDQQDERASGHWNWDVDDAAPSVKLREALDQARAEGERAATERIMKWLRENPSLRPTQSQGWESDGIRESVADAIERGEHE